MKRKTIFSLIIFFFICLIFFLFKGSNNKKTQKIETDISNDVSYHSNIIKDVYYLSKDIRGNEYNGKYYVNLQGWRIESTGSVETAKVVEEVQSLGDLPF